MSDPNGTGGLTATIKFPESARYKSDNPWIVFHGSVSRIREDIVEAFGMEAGAKELSLSDLVLEAQTIASAQGNVATTLGGRTVSGEAKGKSKAEPKAESSPAWEPPAKGGDAAETSDEPAVHPIIAEIAGLTTLTAHRNMWADNKDEIKGNPDFIEAWKDKGRELKAAA